MKKVQGFSILLVLVLLLTACGGNDTMAGQSEMAMESPAEAMDMAADGEFSASRSEGGSFDDGDTSTALSQADFQRIIIYTGELDLVVANTDATIAEINALLDAVGGYVGSTNFYNNTTLNTPQGSLTIRVPAERYSETMAGLRDLAIRVERENSNSQDVTEEFTDLEARKVNLEAAEQALQELLTQQERSGTTEDVLAVYRELTSVRGQIEQIQGRLNYLSRAAGLSTITVRLTPDALSQPLQVAGWQPQGVAKDALETLIESLQTFAEIIIWAVIFFLPTAAVYLSPLVVVILVVRWWWKRRQANKVGPAE